MIYLLGCFLFIGNATSASDSSWWCCYKKTDTTPQSKGVNDDYQIFYDSDTQKDQQNSTTTYNPIAKRSLDRSQGTHKTSAIAMHELKNVVSDVNKASIGEETEV